MVEVSLVEWDWVGLGYVKQVGKVWGGGMVVGAGIG